MKFRKVLLLNYSGKELQPPYWDRIDKLCKEKVLLPADDPALVEQLQGTDCLLVKLGAKIGKDIINEAPNLRYIGMLGTGYGGINDSYAASKNVAVCNIAGYATEGVAEFTFAVILDYTREIERAKRQAREGNYSEASFTGTEIRGKNFGVIGLGSIGGRTAEIAMGFGANVRYWSRRRKDDYEKMGIQFQAVDDLLRDSDFVTINLALNADTENFLNRDRIQIIKKGAVVVNPSPMELVDLDALVMRLKQGDIAFILDHSDEMTSDQLELLKPYSNCVVCPPIAYTTEEATALKQDIFVSNLENFLAGSPTNKVN